MSRQAIAIIGTGIAGLTCGHVLHPHHDITLYERDAVAGGQAHTVQVNEEGHELSLDTGFHIYNPVTYPELTRLFTQLGVATQPVPMTFSVQQVPSGLEFSSAGYNGFFAQRKNLVSPRFWAFLREIRRFNREAPKIFDDLLFQDHTLKEFVQELGFSRDFLQNYLIPIGTLLWSVPVDLFLESPAESIVRFFHSRGLLGWNAQLPWRTVTGGSRMYRDKMILPFRDRLHLNRAAVRVTRRPGAVQVLDPSGDARSFDHVIIATHADEALALLADPTPDERFLLSTFRYQKNIATLHSDPSVMPSIRRAWSPWNYRVDWDRHGQPAASTICWMNGLQGISDQKDYFVSINDPGGLSPARVIQTIEFTHPIFSRAALEAQPRLPELNRNGLVSFCGSYFGYGFHEEAVQSALDVCRPFVAEAVS